MDPSILLGCVLAGVGVPALYGIVQYNGLVGLQNQIREAWSNIDTELKRRHELVPNLVRIVQGYSDHEKAVLERVVELRTRCLARTGLPQDQAQMENQLADAVKQILAVAENYPALKADRAFLELHRELINTEDRIQAARRFYNGNVRDYRIKRESFPSNLVADWFQFGPEEFLQIDSAIRQNPPAAQF